MTKKTVNKEKFGNRLTQLMEEYNETTYSMAERFSLSSPTISRYMSGQMAAKVTTIQLMASYFQVNPIWLMGFDVPKHEKVSTTSTPISDYKPEIMAYYNQLNAIGKETATEHVRLLTLDKKYTNQAIQPFPPTATAPKTEAAHARSDIQQTVDGQTHDDNIMNNDSEWE